MFLTEFMQLRLFELKPVNNASETDVRQTA
jgi:hypothetical protein